MPPQLDHALPKLFIGDRSQVRKRAQSDAVGIRGRIAGLRMTQHVVMRQLEPAVSQAGNQIPSARHDLLAMQPRRGKERQVQNGREGLPGRGSNAEEAPGSQYPQDLAASLL